DELEPPRLERAIGVVYRPDTELQSHYFHATLPHQFDECVGIDDTSAVRPVTEATAQGLPAAHPFALYGAASARHAPVRWQGPGDVPYDRVAAMPSGPLEHLSVIDLTDLRGALAGRIFA